MPEPLEKVVKTLMRYYLHNPSSADTLEGITRWRLQEERVDETLEQVRLALDWLVDQGLLVSQTQGSNTIFRLNPDQVEELRRKLESLEESHLKPGPSGSDPA